MPFPMRTNFCVFVCVLRFLVSATVYANIYPACCRRCCCRRYASKQNPSMNHNVRRHQMNQTKAYVSVHWEFESFSHCTIQQNGDTNDYHNNHHRPNQQRKCNNKKKTATAVRIEWRRAYREQRESDRTPKSNVTPEREKGKEKKINKTILGRRESRAQFTVVYRLRCRRRRCYVPFMCLSVFTAFSNATLCHLVGP